MPLILGSCSSVDIRRVVNAVKDNADPLPEELYRAKGKLALALVLLAMESGMELDDMKDIRDAILWDNNRFEVRFYNTADFEKRRKWKAAMSRPVSVNNVIRKLQK
ncbi:MAG: hypothetical protein PHU03_03045 [Syntrophales bacterium]|nr:hypothetical protein [Syntrophales bacterium]